MGIAQCMDVGTQVHEKTSWPIGVSTAPMHMMLADASGATRPVSGSLSCELMILRQTGSRNIAIRVPIPIPTKDRPVCPGPQPRCCWNTMGYATKHFFFGEWSAFVYLGGEKGAVSMRRWTGLTRYRIPYMTLILS